MRYFKAYLIFLTITAFSFASFFALSCGAKKGMEVSSPDSKIKVTITTKGGINKNQLAYTVLFNGKPLITESPLGISLKDKGGLSMKMKVMDSIAKAADEKIQIPIGKCVDVVNKYNELTVSLSDSSNRMMNLIFRVFDDGAAFRYEIPAQTGLDNLEITNELTSFCFAGDIPYWGLHLPNYQTAYETDYTAAPLSNIKPDSLTALPILLKPADNAWVAITEADLTDYAGMYLRGSADIQNSLVCSLSPNPDNPEVAVSSAAPRQTPWRVLMIAETPYKLIESNIVLCLSKPSAIDDISWIKPGKTAWDWWSGQVVKGQNFTGKTDNRTMKHYIDFASEARLEYMLVDAGWYFAEDTSDWYSKGDITKSIKDIDVPGLVEYGKAKNVDILLWINWKAADRQMDEAFPLYEKWGVKGVKIDFMNRDDQYMVNFYERTVKKAAEHHLTVDFHGAYKPTGLRRTYPNLLTREGVLGLEFSKWSKRVSPEHDCTIPFTRMLAGPLDYTPGGFTNATLEKFVPQMTEPMTQGTRCHQLALYVVFESPLQMLADYPENYKKGIGLDFLKQVPATWDETFAVDGEVSNFVSIARKKGTDWYIGTITDWNARDLQFQLLFIGEGKFVAEIYSDADDADKNPENVKMETFLVNSQTVINIKLAPGGGNAIRLSPAPEGTDLPEYK